MPPPPPPPPPPAPAPMSRRPTIEQTAARLADLLTYAGGALNDPERHDLVFESDISLLPLTRLAPPADVWAVDGGQAVVADARCLQLVVTRAARGRWLDGRCVLEEEGELRPQLVGCGEERLALLAYQLPVRPDAAVDIGLLRDWGEWQAVADSVEQAEWRAMVLLDGDLEPDWRIPPSYLTTLFERAAVRGVTVVGVTKHSSLARGGAPLLGQLERWAEQCLGPRAMWWARLATTRPDSGPTRQILAARLDPDARFSFRVDLPLEADAEAVLGRLSALADDAAFPGYPYPLSVADRLAACPSWVRDDVRARLEDGLDAAGVPLDVRERAFTDRHRLMERA
ncbi:MAG: DNA double-strand break repair nuclease NurA [Actinomycetota bacterium]|nr:DNA double-strand break repair nuclease NurA [Actinomycetota bacterium]